MDLRGNVDSIFKVGATQVNLEWLRGRDMLRGNVGKGETQDGSPWKTQENTGV